MPSDAHRPPTRRNPERVQVHVNGRAVLALTPEDRRVRVGLVMPVVDRVVDVSVQPATSCRALADAVRRTRIPFDGVEAHARRAVLDAAGRSGAWRPHAGMCLARTFGGVAFPLLGAAYDEGGEPLLEVPRWAEPVLAATTVGHGATAAFGTKATRPVRRALVEAIRPLASGQVDLTVLALALIGRDALEPDTLARLLRCDRVAQPPEHLPDPATLRAARPVLDEWGPTRAERVLLDAAARPDGMSRLLDTVRYARQLGDHGPSGRLRGTLDAVHDAHRALMRSAPAPIAAPTSASSAGSSDAPLPCARPVPVRPAPPQPPHRVLPPPVPARRVRADTPLALPATARAVDGREIGDLRVVLPRTAGDLERWGRLLGNCLGDFGPSAAAGRSVVIGIMRANRLAYAMELTPGGTIRQFSGRSNRRPRDHDRVAVIRALAAAGVVDVQASGNRPWLAAIPDASSAGDTDAEDSATDRAS